MDTSVADLTATRLLGCCSIFIVLQQLKVFLFQCTTNTSEAAAKVRVAPFAKLEHAV